MGKWRHGFCLGQESFRGSYRLLVSQHLVREACLQYCLTHRYRTLFLKCKEGASLQCILTT